MQLIYNIGILIFTALTYIISPFSKKAGLLISGRRGWKKKLADDIKPGGKYLWIHCASLGEFEQGRPVIEALKNENPELKIVLTFFSSSGYEVRKKYPHADVICYLPPDTPSNARHFISLVKPVSAVIVKYEFWSNYISELHRKKVPLYLISGIFRPGQHFFKWYGGFFRKMLQKFTRIFVQDNNSLYLLKGIGINDVIVAGDTRFDRVKQIASSARVIPELERFRGNEKLFLAGSSWQPDEEIIAAYINRFPSKMKWVFAPHEIESSNIERLEKFFSVKTARFSQFDSASLDARVLIIDNIGMLSSAYRYAYIACIGGGFGKGIHNILEAACWRIPVMFGPRHEKFREALEMIADGGAEWYDSYGKFAGTLDRWLTDEKLYRQAADAAGSYVARNAGATNFIITELRQSTGSWYNIPENKNGSATYFTKA
jgi:3-deoxy-D-manno-octulosonic-acid transferase